MNGDDPCQDDPMVLGIRRVGTGARGKQVKCKISMIYLEFHIRN